MRYFVFVTLLSLLTIFTNAQRSRSNEIINYQLSSHVLDISIGKPAYGVKIRLEKYKEHNKSWVFVDENFTDVNGRISNFLNTSNSNIGTYKLTFLTNDYFKKNNTNTFYPYIEVIFKIIDDTHYHVPITLSPFGYSTYRGS